MTASEGAQAVLKSLRILEAVAAGHHALGRIAEETGIPPSTVHRLLGALMDDGYVRRGEASRYRLGPRLIALGFEAREQLQLPSLARPYMDELARRTAETVHLGVLDGREVMYVEKVPGTRGLQMASYVGARVPVQCTALGKVLVAGRPRDEWDAYFDPDLRRTPASHGDRAAYLDAIEAVAARGSGFDLEENEAGIRCVAAPIRAADGAVAAAISLSGARIYLSDDRLRALEEEVIATARAVSQACGWTGA